MNSFLFNTLSRYFDGFTKRLNQHSNDTLNVISLDHNKESIEYIDNYSLTKEATQPMKKKSNFFIDFKQKFFMYSFIYGFKLYGSAIKSVKKDKETLSLNYNYV